MTKDRHFSFLFIIGVNITIEGERWGQEQYSDAVFEMEPNSEKVNFLLFI
jgi:hypothetical protein